MGRRLTSNEMRLNHDTHNIRSRLNLPELSDDILNNANLLLVLLFRVSVRSVGELISVVEENGETRRTRRS